MQALILAAGRGSRMEALVDGRPKCLVELAHKPLIERQIAALRGGGATSIGIVRGYLGDRIKIADAAYFDNPRWSETNMVMSLATAAVWLRTQPVIVSYGDIFYRREVVRALLESTGDLVVAYDRAWRALWTRRFTDPLSDAETFRTDSAGNLVDIGRPTTRIEDIKGQYMGLLKFTPAAWRLIENVLAPLDPRIRDALDMTSLLRRLLGTGFQIQTLSAESQWGEIDSPADLALYERMVEDGELALEG
jgi:L-glutamine-phosphate cytidylyltransferase